MSSNNKQQQILNFSQNRKDYQEEKISKSQNKMQNSEKNNNLNQNANTQNQNGNKSNKQEMSMNSSQLASQFKDYPFTNTNQIIQLKIIEEHKKQNLSTSKKNKQQQDRQNYEEIMIIMKEIMTKKQKDELDYQKLQDIISQQIYSYIHPQEKTQVGRMLLTNGLFIRWYIEILVRHQQEKFLEQYLYSYFQKRDIVQEKQFFIEKANQIFDEQFKNKKKKQKKNTLRKTRLQQNTNQEIQQVDNQVNIGQKNSSDNKKIGIAKPVKRSNKSAIKNQKSKQQLSVQKDTKNQEEQKEKLGSFYKYVVKQPKKPSLKRQLLQKRTSARIESKKRQKQQQKSESAYDIQQDKNRKATKINSNIKNRGQIGQRKSVRIQQKNSKQKNSKQKNSKQKRQKQERSLNSPRSHNKHQNQSQMIEHLQLSWIKDHFKEIDVTIINLDQSYDPLSIKDEQITQFIKSLNQKNSRETKIQNQNQILIPNDGIVQNQMQIQKQHQLKVFQQQYQQRLKSKSQILEEKNRLTNSKTQQNIKPDNSSIIYQKVDSSINSKRKDQQLKQYKVDLPLSIQAVIDNNINNHGIYALLKLGKITSFQLNTKYALTNLTNIGRAKKRHIVQDLQKAAQLAGVKDHSQLGFIKLNTEIIKLLESSNKK